MFGLSPVEVLLVVPVAIVSLIPTAAGAVFLWLVFSRRFPSKKTCPKCGADLRRS